MLPALAPLAIQAGGALLGGILGRKRSREEERRQREFRAQMMRIASPQYMQGLQQQLYNQSLAGPAFGAARRGVFNAGSNMSNQLQGSFAARGLGGSGVGAVAPALARSAMAGQMGQLRTGMYGQAGMQAGQQQEREMSALQGLGPQQSSNYGSQAMAGGLGDISKYLQEYDWKGGGGRVKAPRMGQTGFKYQLGGN